MINVDYEELSLPLRSALFAVLVKVEKKGEMTEQSISNSLLGLSRMKIKFADDLPKEVQQSLLAMVRSKAATMTKQHQRMTSAR